MVVTKSSRDYSGSNGSNQSNRDSPVVMVATKVIEILRFEGPMIQFDNNLNSIVNRK